MAELELRGLSCRVGAAMAVQDVSLSVDAGEVVALLGPAAAGKSALLAAIAGLLPLAAGSVWFRGHDLARVPPQRRGFGVAFQQPVLWPHLTVAGNVLYPLRLRRLERGRAEGRMQAALDLVQMLPLADRRPDRLSVAERQRVAVARAMVFGAPLLLFDAPLAALDAGERAELWQRLLELQPRLNGTLLVATRDVAEAQAMAGRIAVLHRGALQQVGTAAELYAAPRTRLVAELFGPANVLAGMLRELRPGGFVWVAEGVRLVQAVPAEPSRPALGSPVSLCLRPERIVMLADAAQADNEIAGNIVGWRQVGGTFDVSVSTPLGLLRLALPAGSLTCCEYR